MRLSDHDKDTLRLQELSREIAIRQAEFDTIKDNRRKEALGQHEGYTIYEVAESTVKQHNRRSYRAVRINQRVATT